MSQTERHSLDHGEVRVQTQGPEDGRPVLMIHGLSYPLEVWGPVADRLVSQGNRVVTYDLYGRGQSGWDGAPLSTELQAEQALAVMDIVGFRGAVNVVSLSNADLIALWLAAMVPERIRTVSLLAPSGLDPRTRRGSVTFSNHPWLRGISATLMVRRLTRRMGAHRSDLPPDAEPLSIAAFDAAIDSMRRNPSAGRAALSHLANWPTIDDVRGTVDVLSDLRIPMTAVVYGGETDATEDGVDQLLSGLAHLSRVEIPAGGHMGPITQPLATADALTRHFTGRGHTP